MEFLGGFALGFQERDSPIEVRLEFVRKVARGLLEEEKRF